MKRTSFSLLMAMLVLLLTASGALAAQMNFRAHMASEVIVPLPAGVESNAQGQAIFHLSDDEMTVDYKINVANVDHVIMAHIHRYVGDGRNGPILVWLYPSPTSSGPGSPTGRVDGNLVKGSFDASNVRGGLTLEQVVEMMRTGEAYVNVHTSQAPAGEINGHIH